MDNERIEEHMRTMGDALTRRGVLLAVAGVAALQLRETAAKRRHRGTRQRRWQAAGQLSAESRPAPVTIETSNLRGSPGTFTATGAIEDVGTFTSQPHNFGGIGAPTFLIVHSTDRFIGEHGTFTIKREIKETVTADPLVLTGEGTWVVHGGTGAYDRLHAQGTVTSVVDEHQEPALFRRTFTGTAHDA